MTRIDVAEARRLIDEDGLSIRAAARTLGCNHGSLSRALRRPASGDDGREVVEVRGDNAVIDSRDMSALADPDALMVRRGLDPDEWEVTGSSITEWGRDPETGEPYQRLKINLTRRRTVAALVLPEPVEPIPLPRPRRRTGGRPRLGFVATDFHAPFHDEGLLDCFLRFCQDVELDFGVFGGDVSDVPEPSRHPRNQAFHCTPRESFRSGHQIIAATRAALPDAELAFVPGNHDDRVRRWILAHAPELADLPDLNDDRPLLSLRRLLGLDKLHVETVEPDGEYADGEYVVCRNLKVIHGERTGKNATDAELQSMGHSVAFGHTHRKDSTFRTLWDFDGAATHVAINVGCMCQIDGGLGYVRRPNWQQGFGVVQVWDDGAFTVEHANYVNGQLLWRGERW